MTSPMDTPNRIPWPPLLYVMAIAVSIVLAWLVPLPWVPPPLSEILFAAGWLVAIGGLVLIVQAIRTLRKANTTFRPNEASAHLVTTGPFALSRNPIYLGDTMIMVGAALISGIGWFILFGLVAAFATQKLAIEREERHLETRFGKKFREYAKRVRRWI